MSAPPKIIDSAQLRETGLSMLEAADHYDKDPRSGRSSSAMRWNGHMMLAVAHSIEADDRFRAMSPDEIRIDALVVELDDVLTVLTRGAQRAQSAGDSEAMLYIEAQLALLRDMRDFLTGRNDGFSRVQRASIP